MLDPGRATATLILPLGRWGGSLGFTTGFQRLRRDIVLYFDLHVLGFKSGHISPGNLACLMGEREIWVG